MSTSPGVMFRGEFRDLATRDPQQVPQLVAELLKSAQQAGASDLHLVPSEAQLEVHWRIDGVLQPVESFSRSIAANIVARLKVLAELLTYRTEVPQEGRIRQGETAAEMRVSTFPTLFGEKVVVRLFVGSGRYRKLSDLALPADVESRFAAALQERGGLLLVTGPAGSGKTTTVYAGLRELAEQSQGQRSLVSIEDPIEAVIPGVAQSQVQPAAGFTYESGLRSLLRQDPDVILVGEVRDRTTAELVFQAALSGHLVLSTYHAGTADGALQRLRDMGIEPYQIKSGLQAVVSQRLLRRLCRCATVSHREEDRLALDVAEVRLPTGCPECRGTGYVGRQVLAEWLDGNSISLAPDGALMPSTPDQSPRLFTRGIEAVRRGETSPTEFRRVFGLK
ncbi:MAG: GspE/PulE family protein [Planctomycetaceae bacterium]